MSWVSSAAKWFMYQAGVCLRFLQHEATRGYLCSLLDRMLVHGRVDPSIKLAVTKLYIWVERGTMKVKCALPKNTRQCPRSGLETRPHDPETTAPRGYLVYTCGICAHIKDGTYFLLVSTRSAHLARHILSAKKQLPSTNIRAKFSLFFIAPAQCYKVSFLNWFGV